MIKSVINYAIIHQWHITIVSTQYLNQGPKRFKNNNNFCIVKLHIQISSNIFLLKNLL